MSDLPILLGEVRGELKALRSEHDRHAELARKQFAALHVRLDELRVEKVERTTKATIRKNAAESLRWVAMLIAAAFAGHVGAAGH